MLTRIFSRSRIADKGYEIDCLEFVWFPEISYHTGGAAMPVHPVDQIKAAHRLIGKTVVTMSEHIILWFLREIREERMKLDDVELYCDGQRIRIDSDGELINKWPGGFSVNGQTFYSEGTNGFENSYLYLWKWPI